MTDNPFKPPQADLRERPPRPGSPVRAVLLGLAVDIGGSLLAGVVLTLFQAAAFASAGMSQEQAMQALQSMPPNSTFSVLGQLLGAGFSVAGGFVCARVARRDEYRLGGAMSVLSVVCGLLLGGAAEPGDMLVLGSLSTIACVLLGAKYGRALNRRTREPAG